MIDEGAKEGAGRGQGAGVNVWRLLGLGVIVAGLVLLGAFGALGYGLSGLGGSAASVGRSLESVVRSPDRAGRPPVGAGWRLTPANAVIFRAGYFCATTVDGPRVRLVLSLRELDTLTQGGSSVLGPFSSKAQTRGAC